MDTLDKSVFNASAYLFDDGFEIEIGPISCVEVIMSSLKLDRSSLKGKAAREKCADTQHKGINNEQCDEQRYGEAQPLIEADSPQCQPAHDDGNSQAGGHRIASGVFALGTTRKWSADVLDRVRV